MNRLWRERVTQAWREQHEEIKKSQQRLAELNEQANTRALTIDEQWERVVALSYVEDDAATVPFLRALLKESPSHVMANFVLGRILLTQRDPEGIEYLERSMKESPDLTMQACEAISGFYLEEGKNELAEEFRKRAEEAYKKAVRLREQALNFAATDQLVPHDLEDARVKEMQAQLAKVYGLAAAYFFRKIIDGADQPLYVMAVVADYTWREGVSAKHIEPLFNELSEKVVLPSPVVMLSLDHHAYLLNRVRRIPAAQVFRTPEVGVTVRH